MDTGRIIKNVILPISFLDNREEKYMEKLSEILHRYNGSRAGTGPAKLLNHLYLGNLSDAFDVELLKKLKITGIINCAAVKDYSAIEDNPYEEGSGITEYVEFEALDNPSYPMLRHYKHAEQFINRVKDAGGRVLVHCELGINRSGALCVAYMMVTQDLTLLEAVRAVKAERSVLLTNQGFVKQLYNFAEERELLYKNRE